MKPYFRRLFPVNYSAIKTFALVLLQLEFIRYQGKRTLLVYTMGKVGSSSVASSFRKYTNFRPIYHIHTLSNNRIYVEENVYKKNPNRIGAIHNHLLSSIFLKRKIFKTYDKFVKWNIVSLVRDPIQRNISAFFQTLNLHDKDLGFAERIINGKDSKLINDMLHYFVTKYNHSQSGPFMWFDVELKKHFGIDVLNNGFPKEKGYGIYHGECADVLVIRLEDLNRCASEAFKEFAGIKNFKLEKKQDSAKKYYATVYQEFLRQARFPQDFLNRMYDSEYANTFYTESEIDTFRRKWGKTN